MNNEAYIDRVISTSVTGRDDDFRQRLRTRDGGCVLSGVRNRAAHRGQWKSFNACHIFPLEKGQEWVRQGLHRWITDSDSLDPGPRMNSIQNGMIMSASIHNLFDGYHVGVNPDVSISVLVSCSSSA